jgi:nitroreductase
MDDASRPEPDASAFPADADGETRAEFLLQYAVLAPSSHNSQPWLFGVEDGEIRVYADESRQLTVADPDGRELYVSVGCALENLLTAAERFGVGCAVEYASADGPREDGGDAARHVATVRLDRGAAAATGRGASSTTDRGPALFDAIADRRTNHRPFRSDPVPESVLERFEADAASADVGLELVTDSARRAQIASLQTRADERQFDDPSYRAELGRWIGDGSLGAGWLAARVGQLAVRHLDIGVREGEKNSKLVTSAPVVAVLTADDDTVESRLRVGQAFERAALTATSEGLAVHPMSQILEVEDLRSELSELLGLDDAEPVHLFRIGYADPDPTLTPRRPVEDVLL